MKRLLIILMVLSNFAINSCSKKNDATTTSASKFLTYTLENQKVSVSIDNAAAAIKITFPDTTMNADNIIADFTLPNGSSASVNNIQQVSGVSNNSYSAPFSYILTSSRGALSWSVTSTNNNYTHDWGLGYFISENKSNNRSYEWYIDQLNTGFDAVDNCGPTAVTMACKWSDSTFTKTPEDARKVYVPAGGWWFTSDIDNYLTDNNVAHSIFPLPQTATDAKQIIKKQVDANQLVLLCIDMNYIRQTNNNDYHIDKFYSTTPGFGHFFIIKGYRVVDNEMFFQVYDPNSWGQRNTDGSYKGEDRFYRYEDVFAAANNWWQFAFNIAKKGSVLVNGPVREENKNIPVQFGR